VSEGRFTGERLPGTEDDFAVDLERHLAAYRFAAARARGLSVLDAGCGEGYGAALLAGVAARVVGVDRPEAVAVARGRHREPHLEFRALDLGALDRLGERFDLVCSFQVLEHVVDPPAYLRALLARTAPGGELIVTTPNRLMTVVENPYHLREWTAPELLALATPVVPGVQLLGVHGSPAVLAYDRARGAAAARWLRFDPLGLRRLLPPGLVARVYPHLARLVRRRVRAVGARPAAIGPADFTVGGTDLEHALDLLLLRPRDAGVP
jgi:SAM-dependent methyltransferase